MRCCPRHLVPRSLSLTGVSFAFSSRFVAPRAILFFKRRFNALAEEVALNSL
jgi:hypothetical protein